MNSFRCIPIASATATRFRTSGEDDRGNALRRMEASHDSGFSCRHCLCSATRGEIVLLGSYDLTRPRGIYWTPSPIFVHAAPCLRFERPGEMAPIVFANGLVSVRAYDAMDQVIYELGRVCEGALAQISIRDALDDVRTAFINVHTARPGCLLNRIERV